MNTIALTTSVLVLLGALFMFAAIVQGRKIRGRVPPELRRRWRIMVILMFFFMTSYLVLIVMLVSHPSFPTELITGPVFLGGAIFVFTVIDLTRDTISMTMTAEKELRLLNESLEQRVTERARELQRSHEFFRTVLNSLNDEVAIIDVNDFKIVGMNAAFRKVYALTEGELIGRTCHEITHNRPDVCTPPDDVCPLLETARTGGYAAAEHVHYDKNGNKIYVEVTSSPLRDKDGKIIQVVHVSRDITGRKTAEKALRESEEKFHRLSEQLSQSNKDLQEVNEELKNFAYIVSHDLRAPLVNIKGFSDELIHGIREIGPVLEKYLDGFTPEERRQFSQVLSKDIPEALGFIGSSVSRMDGQINALLALSRMGRRELKPERINMKELTNSILGSLAHQIGTKSVRVNALDLPDVVADRTALEQIFGNLLDNAVKYLEPGRAGEIDVSAERAAAEVVFHVSDNGRGIAADDIPKAFEIFKRVGKQDTPGEGMGLAYVKALVKRHGGRIWCESEPGVGTTFIFTLPHTPDPGP